MELIVTCAACDARRTANAATTTVDEFARALRRDGWQRLTIEGKATITEFRCPDHTYVSATFTRKQEGV